MPEDEPSQVSNRAAARGAKEGSTVVSTVNDAGVATTKRCGRVIGGGVWGVAGDLAQQAVFQDAADGADAVFPADFFAFGVGAAVVGDGDFVDAGAGAGDLGDELGFDAEAVFLELYGLDEFAFENFVAGLHVREVEIGRHVRQEGEELVAEGVPEIEYAVLMRAVESGAEDGVRLAAENGLEQRGVVGGIVFEVGVLDEHDVRRGFADAGSQGSAFALIALVPVQADALLGRRRVCQHFECAIFGTVIHHHHFGHARLCEHQPQNGLHSGPLVEDGHDDRDIGSSARRCAEVLPVWVCGASKKEKFLDWRL